MRLTGSKMCVFCDAVQIMLADHQIQYSFAEDETKIDYPAIEYKDFCICGFIAIAEYVSHSNSSNRILEDALNTEKRYYIENLKKESNKRMWLFVALNEVWYGAAQIVMRERVLNVKKGLPCDFFSLKQARTNLKLALFDLNTWLSENIYIVDISCYTDTLIATMIAFLDYLGEMEWDKYKNLKSWYSAIKTKPSFKHMLNKNIPGHKPPSWYKELDF